MKSKEEIFWQWFEDNATKLWHYEDDQESVFDEIMEKLVQVHPALAFEMGKSGTICEFIISAGGNVEGFPAVQNLVKQAPSLTGWEFIAFIPRRGTGYGINYEGCDLTPKHIFFIAEADGSRVGLNFFITKEAEPSADAVMGALFLLLQNALGEYDLETKISFIEPQSIPHGNIPEGAEPFKNLPLAVDSLYAMLNSAGPT